MSAGTLTRPRWHTDPGAGFPTAGPAVGVLSARVGFAPDPEQQIGLDMIFAERARRRPVLFEFCVVCARQNLKTGLFKQAALGWLFIEPQELIVWSAHEFNTAQEAFRDMIALLEHPILARHVAIIRTGAGKESIELKTGQRLIFKARTKTGGRGLTGNRVVLDEGFALQPEHMGALLPTLSVVPDAQVVYGSSAGLAQSEVLRGIRDRGRSGRSPRLGYIEWGNDRGGCELEDRCHHYPGVEGCALDRLDLVANANPLLGKTRPNGTGLTVEYVLGERQALPPAEFARERLGWWDDPSGPDAVFGAGHWDSCAGTGRPAGLKPGALAVAVSYDLSRSAVAAAAANDRALYGKPLRHGPGTDWVVDRAKDEQARHGCEVVVDGNGPAAMLIPDLEDAGVRLHVTTTHEVLDACAGLFDAVHAHRFRHERYHELDAAIGAAVKRPVGDRWAWGRRQSTDDISALEAVTLASWWADRGRDYDVMDSVH